MKHFLSLIVACFASFSLFGQINMADSTVQVIGYWWMGDTQTYTVTEEKYKVKDADTTGYQKISYEVDVSVKDSTADSYIVEWYYKNHKLETENELARKLMKIASDIKVEIKTDEYGAIEEVVNWKEVQKYTKKAAKELRKELKGVPNAKLIVNKVLSMYSSEAAVRSLAIKDAQQFYNFHGGAYSLGEELNGQIQLPNNFGGKPFDTEASIYLDELSEEEDYAVLRSYLSVDSQQLTDATYEYLKKLSGNGGKGMPARSEFPALSNETWMVSYIDGDTGWVIYSAETKEVMAEGVTQVEERILEIQ